MYFYKLQSLRYSIFGDVPILRNFQICNFNTNIDTKELTHPEMTAAIVHRLTKKLSMEKIENSYLKACYMDHTLVLPCGNFGELSTRSLCHCCVVISQRCHRIASFFRLALTQISGTDFHRYFRNAVLGSGGMYRTRPTEKVAYTWISSKEKSSPSK